MPAKVSMTMDLDPADGSFPLDAGGYLRDVMQKAQMFRDGHAAGLAAGKEARKAGIRPAGLVFAGMGFSGASSELVKDACTRALDLPFTIVKHYQFPHHVDDTWHMIAVSYSGATEETLTLAKSAAEKGVPITTFATGGPIAKFGGRNVLQPTGHQPRAALTFAWASILGYLEGLQMLRWPVPVDEAVAAIESVDRVCGPTVPEADNEAKQLARILYQKIPQIYATPAFYGIGHCFRGFLNENAKKIAGSDVIPDCNHNDLSGWAGDEDNRKHFTVLMLSHAAQNPEIKKRIAFMEEQYTSWGVPWHHHEAAEIHTYEQHVVAQAETLQFLDYAGFYTAMLRGVDPSEIKAIVALKSYLRN